MERPAKRQKLTNLIPRAIHDAASRLSEGLFTSELGMQSDETDGDFQVTTTSSRNRVLRRRAAYGEAQRYPRPQIPPRAIQARAPDATVTASILDVAIADGSTTTHSTVSVTAGATVINVNGLIASVTAPASSVASSTDDSGGLLSSLVASISDLSTLTSTDLPTLTSTDSPTLTSTDSPTLTSTNSPTLTSTNSPTLASTDLPILTSTVTPTLSTSLTSGVRNGTMSSITSSSSHTMTVTHTSTLNLSVSNGTLIYATSTTSGIETSISTGTNGILYTYTFSSGPTTAPITSVSPSSTSSYNGPLFGQSASFITTVTASNTEPAGSSGAAGSYNSNGGSGPTSTSSSSESSAPSATNSGSGTGSGPAPLTPQQQQAVGGAVGGVAGVALILCLVLFFLRWYRNRLKSSGRLPEQLTDAARTRGLGGGGGMSHHSSGVPFAAALASSFKRLRPHSSYQQTNSLTESSVADSERGFQRVGGRKIPSVLKNGGDGFGETYGAFEKNDNPSRTESPLLREHDLSEKSFYRDKDGLYTSDDIIRSAPSSPLMQRTHERDFASGSSAFSRSSLAPRATEASLARPGRPEGFAVMRSSPARTPVMLSPSSSSIALPIQQATGVEHDKNAPAVPVVPPSFGLQVPKLRDGVGRSLASRDGSRVSTRSARFVENLS